MRWLRGLVLATVLGGCTPMAMSVPPSAAPLRTETSKSSVSVNQAARNFVTAVKAVEPVAESYCRKLNRVPRCDFLIAVDDRPNQPANAYQFLDASGRPVLAFTLALIADARNTDELAFVMGHESAHHILGHIPLAEQSAQQGALLAGLLVAVSGGGAAAVQDAQRIGASVGARRFSKGFELEADRLGAEITERAGFSALRGAEFFARIPDPGDRFLGSHPPNAERIAVVRRTVAELR